MDKRAWCATVHRVCKELDTTEVTEHKKREHQVSSIFKVPNVGSYTEVSGLGLLAQWRGKWQPTPVSLPGESHGWGNLVGCSPWGRKESGMTGRLTLTYQHRGQFEISSFMYLQIRNQVLIGGHVQFPTSCWF